MSGRSRSVAEDDDELSAILGPPQVKAVHYYHNSSSYNSHIACRTPTSTAVTWKAPGGRDKVNHSQGEAATAMPGWLPPSPHERKKSRAAAAIQSVEMTLVPDDSETLQSFFCYQGLAFGNQSHLPKTIAEDEASTVVVNNRSKKGLSHSIKNMVQHLAKRVLPRHKPTRIVKIRANEAGLSTPPRAFHHNSTPATWSPSPHCTPQIAYTAEFGCEDSTSSPIRLGPLFGENMAGSLIPHDKDPIPTIEEVIIDDESYDTPEERELPTSTQLQRKPKTTTTSTATATPSRAVLQDPGRTSTLNLPYQPKQHGTLIVSSVVHKRQRHVMSPGPVDLDEASLEGSENSDATLPEEERIIDFAFVPAHSEDQTETVEISTLDEDLEMAMDLNNVTVTTTLDGSFAFQQHEVRFRTMPAVVEEGDEEDSEERPVDLDITASDDGSFLPQEDESKDKWAVGPVSYYYDESYNSILHQPPPSIRRSPHFELSDTFESGSFPQRPQSHCARQRSVSPDLDDAMVTFKTGPCLLQTPKRDSSTHGDLQLASTPNRSIPELPAGQKEVPPQYSERVDDSGIDDALGWTKEPNFAAATLSNATKRSTSMSAAKKPLPLVSPSGTVSPPHKTIVLKHILISPDKESPHWDKDESQEDRLSARYDKIAPWILFPKEDASYTEKCLPENPDASWDLYLLFQTQASGCAVVSDVAAHKTAAPLHNINEQMDVANISETNEAWTRSTEAKGMLSNTTSMPVIFTLTKESHELSQQAPKVVTSIPRPPKDTSKQLDKMQMTTPLGPNLPECNGLSQQTQNQVAPIPKPRKDTPTLHKPQETATPLSQPSKSKGPFKKPQKVVTTSPKPPDEMPKQLDRPHKASTLLSKPTKKEALTKQTQKAPVIDHVTKPPKDTTKLQNAATPLPYPATREELSEIAAKVVTPIPITPKDMPAEETKRKTVVYQAAEKEPLRVGPKQKDKIIQAIAEPPRDTPRTLEPMHMHTSTGAKFVVKSKLLDKKSRKIRLPVFSATQGRMDTVWEEPRSLGPVDLDDSLASDSSEGYTGPIDLDDSLATSSGDDTKDYPYLGDVIEAKTGKEKNLHPCGPCRDHSPQSGDSLNSRRWSDIIGDISDASLSDGSDEVIYVTKTVARERSMPELSSEPEFLSTGPAQKQPKDYFDRNGVVSHHQDATKCPVELGMDGKFWVDFSGDSRFTHISHAFNQSKVGTTSVPNIPQKLGKKETPPVPVHLARVSNCESEESLWVDFDTKKCGDITIFPKAEKRCEKTGEPLSHSDRTTLSCDGEKAPSVTTSSVEADTIKDQMETIVTSIGPLKSSQDIQEYGQENCDAPHQDYQCISGHTNVNAWSAEEIALTRRFVVSHPTNSKGVLSGRLCVSEVSKLEDIGTATISKKISMERKQRSRWDQGSPPGRSQAGTDGIFGLNDSYHDEVMRDFPSFDGSDDTVSAADLIKEEFQNEGSKGIGNYLPGTSNNETNKDKGHDAEAADVQIVRELCMLKAMDPRHDSSSKKAKSDGVAATSPLNVNVSKEVNLNTSVNSFFNCTRLSEHSMSMQSIPVSEFREVVQLQINRSLQVASEAKESLDANSLREEIKRLQATAETLRLAAEQANYVLEEGKSQQTEGQIQEQQEGTGRPKFASASDNENCIPSSSNSTLTQLGESSNANESVEGEKTRSLLGNMLSHPSPQRSSSTDSPGTKVDVESGISGGISSPSLSPTSVGSTADSPILDCGLENEKSQPQYSKFSNQQVPSSDVIHVIEQIDNEVSREVEVTPLGPTGDGGDSAVTPTRNNKKSASKQFMSTLSQMRSTSIESKPKREAIQAKDKVSAIDKIKRIRDIKRRPADEPDGILHPRCTNPNMSLRSDTDMNITEGRQCHPPSPTTEIDDVLGQPQGTTALDEVEEHEAVAVEPNHMEGAGHATASAYRSPSISVTPQSLAGSERSLIQTKKLFTDQGIIRSLSSLAESSKAKHVCTPNDHGLRRSSSPDPHFDHLVNSLVRSVADSGTLDPSHQTIATTCRFSSERSGENEAMIIQNSLNRTADTETWAQSILVETVGYDDEFSIVEKLYSNVEIKRPDPVEKPVETSYASDSSRQALSRSFQNMSIESNQSLLSQRESSHEGPPKQSRSMNSGAKHQVRKQLPHTAKASTSSPKASLTPTGNTFTSISSDGSTAFQDFVAEGIRAMFKFDVEEPEPLAPGDVSISEALSVECTLESFTAGAEQKPISLADRMASIPAASIDTKVAFTPHFQPLQQKRVNSQLELLVSYFDILGPTLSGSMTLESSGYSNDTDLSSVGDGPRSIGLDEDLDGLSHVDADYLMQSYKLCRSETPKRSERTQRARGSEMDTSEDNLYRGSNYLGLPIFSDTVDLT